MTFFFQAFFFIFYRKTPKRAGYPHFKAPSAAIFRPPRPAAYELPFFVKFRGFNIFENRINPIYQQLINLCKTGARPAARSALFFCNFNFTFENFTLVYIPEVLSVTGNIKGTHNKVLPFFYMEFRHL